MFRLTLIHPCIGHRAGARRRYLRLWEMEPLQPAVLAALTPRDVDIRFHDDRLADIPFDEPTDLVAISVETYTAKRAYQIASEYRRRKVPVVMGGFHASLCTDEVLQYAESVVVGEAETVWAELIEDYRMGTPKRLYSRAAEASFCGGVLPDRTVFRGKRYLPLGLVETGRGCAQHCEFCAVQRMFGQRHKMRDPADVVAEIQSLRARQRSFFLVDDNLTANPERTKELCRLLMPLRIRWMSQATIQVGQDEELLRLMVQSGCVGVLIGFESLNRDNLAAMEKPLNLSGPDYASLIDAVQRHHLAIYGSFVFGYAQDTLESFDEAVAFARRTRLYIGAFNHLIPFPGTALYSRLQAEGRLRYPAWWLDDRYRFNQVPFHPDSMTAQQLQDGCLAARRAFYTWGSIWERRRRSHSMADGFLKWHYWMLNLLHQREVGNRDGYPLGDEAWQGEMLKVS